jgi:hypothetical protein
MKTLYEICEDSSNVSFDARRQFVMAAVKKNNIGSKVAEQLF